MNRRYKVGENPDYDQIYDLKEKQSDLLHPDPHPSSHTHFLNRTNLNALKYDLLGDQKGLVRDNWGTVQIATIPALAEKLEEIEKRFESWQKRCKAEGREVPLKMTDEQQAEKFLCQAIYDVRCMELGYVQDLLDNYVEEEDKSSDLDVLRSGPIGSAKLKGGQIILLDGQICSVDDESGTPYINDPRTRYNGLATATYYKSIVSVYQKARRKAAEEIEKQIREKKLIREHVPKGKLSGSAPWPEIPAGTKLYNTVNAK